MASTFTKLTYHLVYSTKYRRPLIESAWSAELYNYIGGILKNRDGTSIEIGGIEDHIHILAQLSPKFAIVDVLRDIKAISSKWINDRELVRDRFEWQTGYGAFTVSQSAIENVRKYIQNQANHHRGATFQEEFISMLVKHQVEFDPRYVFEDEIIA